MKKRKINLKNRMSYLEEWEVHASDISIYDPAPKEYVDGTLFLKLEEWLRHYKTNLETIGFDKTISDLSPIKGPALIIDKSMAVSSFNQHIHHIKKFKGTIIVCDRALPRVLEHKVPDIVANVDSSYLCMAFYDQPIVKEHMTKIKGVFSATSFPLIIRMWSGKQYFFLPHLGPDLAVTLSAVGQLPILKVGGCVHNLCWILALNLGANPIGVFGIQNSYDSLSESEYPDVEHIKIKNKHGTFYTDPVYQYYNQYLLKVSKFADEELGVTTINTSQSGIFYDKHIEDMSLEDFVRAW